MAVAVNDVLRVSVEFKYKGAEDVVAVFWLRVDTVVDPTPNLVAQECASWAEGQYALVNGIISSNTVGERVVVNNQRKAEFVGEGIFTYVGAGAPPDLPPSVAALAVARTNKPRTQGRKYIGVLTEGTQDDGILTAAARTAVQSFADNWDQQYTAGSGNQYTPGVLDQTIDAAIPPDDFLELISLKAMPDTRTQRRRTLGRGS